MLARCDALVRASVETGIESSVTLKAWLANLYQRDGWTADHVRRVADLAVLIGTMLGVDRPTLEQIERAALLHDVGRLAVPDSLLRKPGPLTDDERTLIRTHVQVAYEIASASPFLEPVATTLFAVRERYDGTGYPLGLSGEAIPLPARIIAVAEGLDTLGSAERHRAGRGGRGACDAGARRGRLLRPGDRACLAPLRGQRGPHRGRGRGSAPVVSAAARLSSVGGRDVPDRRIPDRDGVGHRRVRDARRQRPRAQPAHASSSSSAARPSEASSSAPRFPPSGRWSARSWVSSARGLSKNDYKDLLAMLYQIFKLGQQSGVMALESHFEAPAKSPIMSKYPKFLNNHHAVDFLADSIKVIMSGGLGPHDLEALMDQDIEVSHHELTRPAGTLAKVADALPGLGIVAAVLGVVTTMESIGGPPEEIGHKVGAALVGTFLGILMSYGFAQPLATSLEQRVADDGNYEQCIKAGVLAMYKGFPPMVAIEFARRVLPPEVRPTFDETEQLVKGA